jgi:hypothetical protein
MNDKLEPRIDVDQEHVFNQVIDYVHEKGDDSMRRIVETNQPDSSHWPIRMMLDVILKVLLNGLGESQRSIIKLEAEVEKLKEERTIIT